jgi:hypothetical protein
LRALLVAPKIGAARLLIDLLYFTTQARDVKETPLARSRAA